MLSPGIKQLQNFLTEKLLLDSQHGKSCTLEVCVAGEADADEVIHIGPVSDCLRMTLTHELPMTGDAYYHLFTKQDSYCGVDFEELSWRLGVDPASMKRILNDGEKESLSQKIMSAESNSERRNTVPLSSRGTPRGYE